VREEHPSTYDNTNQASSEISIRLAKWHVAAEGLTPLLALAFHLLAGDATCFAEKAVPRERISLNEGWRFIKGDSQGIGDH